MFKNFLFFLVVLFTFIFPLHFQNSFALEPIPITASSGLENIIFDGKWSSNTEWKPTSYTPLRYEDNSQIYLRIAHQENFIYVHVNVPTDKTIDKGADSAIICFDTLNDKTTIPSSDDYCFSTTIDGKNSFTYQGNSVPAINGYFKKIPNHQDFIAIGTASDNFDRYSNTPHASYEFKIPLELLGRSNNYGFYFSVFDAHTQTHYSWPYSIEKQSVISISSPSQWGDLISPDKSLPEFNSMILLSLFFPLSVTLFLFSKSELFRSFTYKK